MDIPNAFIGKADQPTEEEVSTALGRSARVWKQLLEEFAEKYGVVIQEWNSFSRKYGWSLRLKLKKRTIIHLSPCKDCFRVGFVLGDRAVVAAKQSKISKSLAKLIEDAPKYPEGTGVRLVVKAARDLAPIRKLAELKLQY